MSIFPQTSAASYGVQRQFASPAEYLAFTGLPPRVGDFFYDSTDGRYKYWDGGSWEDMTPTVANRWSIAGNAGTDPSINFLGTTDVQDLAFRTDNIERMRLTVGGYLGIGTDTPTGPIEIAFTASSYNYGIIRNRSSSPAVGAGWQAKANDGAQSVEVSVDTDGNSFLYAAATGLLQISNDGPSIEFWVSGLKAMSVISTPGLALEMYDASGIKRRDNADIDSVAADSLLIRAGDKTDVSATGNGGMLTLRGGSAFGSSGNGGNLVLQGGVSTSAISGAVYINSRLRVRTETAALASSTMPHDAVYYGVPITGAAKTVNLEAISDLGDGTYIIIKDEGGDASAFPITINAGGSDTFDGSATSYSINDDYGFVVLAANDGVWRIVGGSTNPGQDEWVKYTFSYADFAAASLTNSITAFSVPPKTVISGVVIKHSQSFTGGSISSYTISLGVSGSLTRYASAFDTFQSPSDTAIQATSQLSPASAFSAGENVLVTATSVGANLDQATQGSVDIWVRKAVMP